MGFGHRVYKNYDPRAKIVRQIAEDVFSIVGKEPLVDIAMELEKIALTDDYFIKRKLYPNVDFYSESFTRLWESQPKCSPSCSLFQDLPAGWPTGTSSWTTHTTKSFAQDRFTRVIPEEISRTCPRDRNE